MGEDDFAKHKKTLAAKRQSIWRDKQRKKDEIQSLQNVITSIFTKKCCKIWGRFLNLMQIISSKKAKMHKLCKKYGIH